MVVKKKKAEEVAVTFSEDEHEKLADQLYGKIPEDAVEARPAEVMPEREVSAICQRVLRLQRRLQSIEAMLQLAKKDVQGKIDRIENYYSRSILEFARNTIGSSKPRRVILPGGVLSLRKKPGRTEVLDVVAFALWASKNKREDLARAKVTISGLTGEQLDYLLLELFQEMPDDLRDKVKHEYEVNRKQLLEELRETDGKNVPEGVQFVKDEETFTISEGTE